jgi:hypothetical protein
MSTKICKNILVFLSLLIIQNLSAQTQELKPGFSYQEYIKMVQILAYQVDTPWTDVRIEYPNEYRLDYRSNEVALLNRWDLWISNDSIVVIAIRGTVGDFRSWLENFYAAMVPATGNLRIEDEKYFNYKLSSDEKSAVHIGWLLALAYMSPQIESKIDSCINLGFKNFIITGHSQGGAIAYLLTAEILQKKVSKKYASDIRFKTYCSAAPKPGNINFAREYEYLSAEGWAYNVVNAADWVPEVPFTIQTLDDFNEVNPFSDKKSALKNQKFIMRLVMGHAYNRINKPVKKSVKNFQKYLGKKTYKIVKKSLPEFPNPQYATTNYYVRTGQIIVLYPDAEYYKIYPNNPERKFTHHMLSPYLFLAKKQMN